MQILEGAANHIQHLLVCFFVTSAPILNGATEFLALYKWCYQNQKPISLLTILLIGAMNWCTYRLLGASEFKAPFVRCYRLCSTKHQRIGATEGKSVRLRSQLTVLIGAARICSTF